METRRGGVFPAYPKWWISWVGCHPASRHQPTSNSSSSPSGNIVAEAIWDHGSSAASGSNTALMMSVMMASGYCCCCCSIFFRRYYDEMAPLWKISCLLSSLSSFLRSSSAPFYIQISPTIVFFIRHKCVVSLLFQLTGDSSVHCTMIGNWGSRSPHIKRVCLCPLRHRLWTRLQRRRPTWQLPKETAAAACNSTKRVEFWGDK